MHTESDIGNRCCEKGPNVILSIQAIVTPDGHTNFLCVTKKLQTIRSLRKKKKKHVLCVSSFLGTTINCVSV